MIAIILPVLVVAYIVLLIRGLQIEDLEKRVKKLESKENR